VPAAGLRPAAPGTTSAARCRGPVNPTGPPGRRVGNSAPVKESIGCNGGAELGIGFELLEERTDGRDRHGAAAVKRASIEMFRGRCKHGRRRPTGKAPKPARAWRRLHIATL
jgi:hypothetical protein